MKISMSRKAKYIVLFAAIYGLLARRVRLLGRKFITLLGIKTARQKAFARLIEPIVGLFTFSYKKLARSIMLSVGLFNIRRRKVTWHWKFAVMLGWKTSIDSVLGIRMFLYSAVGLCLKYARRINKKVMIVIVIDYSSTVLAITRQLIQGLTSAIFVGVHRAINFISRNVF
jgi:hypothetical protein